MTTWHLLTPEYPPGCGGVGDYTALVAGALIAAGDGVHVWHPGSGAGHVPQHRPGAEPLIHELPDRFGAASRDAIAAGVRANPGVLVAQYVPGAFGARGMNVAFCRWMTRMRRTGVDVRVMFHEPFFYFGSSRPWRNVFAIVQRVMAALLLRASTRIYYSTSTWSRLLRPYGPQTHAEVLPIPATIPVDLPDGQMSAEPASDNDCFQIGHFGTFGTHVADELTAILPALLRRLPAARVLLVGRGGDAFGRTLPPDIRERVTATGAASGAGVALALRACDLLLQPYPDGVTTRRTSMMAALTTSRPVLTTTGPLTEPLWAESSSVALAPAGNVEAMVSAAARLAGDPPARAVLGARGRRLYDEHFALNLTIARMRR